MRAHCRPTIILFHIWLRLSDHLSWTRSFPPHLLITQRCALVAHGRALSHIGTLGGVFPPHFVWCALTNGGVLANKSTVRPLKPVYSSHQVHEQDPDTTLVDSTFIPSPPTASKRCPRELRHVCSSVDDFWRRIEEEQDDTPLDIKHLVLDLQENGVRLFVSPARLGPPLASSFSFTPCFRS